MCRVYWRVIAKIVYSPLLAAILNFCVKCKDVFISEMEQVRVILTKLLSHRDICIVYWRVFTEILLPPLLAAILNFFIKCKNVFILEMERARAILTKSLIHCASAVYLSLFAKILFPPLLAAILNFCIKCVYLGNEASHFSTKFLTLRVPAYSIGVFLQKSFSHHFWRPSCIFA